MTRSRVCSSNAAPTRTGASPRRPQGRALHAAASAGKRELVELLLAHGADPNGGVDSSGVPVSVAATPEIRALLVARGGTTDPYDTSWIDDDAELARVAGDPTETVRVSAGFAMVVGDGRRDRLERLLAAGLRVPSVLTGCQGYLLAHTDMLRTLLAHGMSPNLMNWQHQTLLHLVCQAEGLPRTGQDQRRRRARGHSSRRRRQTLLRGMRNIDRHRSPGRPARTLWRWWSFSSPAVSPRTFPTMNRGPRRSRGPNGASMRRSCRSSGSMELIDSCGRSLAASASRDAPHERKPHAALIRSIAVRQARAQRQAAAAVRFI